MKGKLMNQNNGDQNINNGEQPEATTPATPAQDADAVNAAAQDISGENTAAADTSATSVLPHPAPESADTSATSVLPHPAAKAWQPAAPAQPAATNQPFESPAAQDAPAGYPAPATQPFEAPAAHAAPAAYPSAPAHSPAHSSPGTNTAGAVPAPAAPAGTPAAAYAAHAAAQNAAQQAAAAQHAAAQHAAAHAAPAPEATAATQAIPAPEATQALPNPWAQPAPSPHLGAHAAPGQAGPGYPASNAYPQTLAPAVTAKSKDRKKVGMGMFTGGILAAALVGGLVGGGSLYLLDQQGGSQVASSNSQSAPLIVNNPNSVNEVSAAAAKAMPSVVTISATSGNSGGTGSGIILDKEGHILTNTHVVTLDGAAAHATIEVQTSDGKVYPGTIVGTDPLSDLAVVKIDAPNLVPAELGESSKINVGDTVIAIGSPLGLNGTVTDGIVSTLNRTIQVASSAVPESPSDSSQTPNDGGNGFQFSPPGGGQNQNAATGTVNLNVIQTDAAINPGNSGGALVNTDGKIIGVNVAIASTGGSSDSGSQSGNIGVGFSIPIDHAKRVAQDIIKDGSASHGQLGVSVKGTSATGSDSAFSAGATVASVTSGSAADKAGLKEGDVITKLGDRTISDPSDLTAAVREQPGGATVKLDFTRDGKAQSVDVTLDTMPAN